MNRFVLKNIFIKIYIYHFSINIFIKTKSPSCILEIVSLNKMTSFTSMEEVHIDGSGKWSNFLSISDMHRLEEIIVLPNRALNLSKGRKCAISAVPFMVLGCETVAVGRWWPRQMTAATAKATGSR